MKKHFLLLVLGFATFLGFTLLSTEKAYAGTCEWTGAVDLNWSESGNWDGTCVGTDGIPGDGDTLHFPAEVTNRFMLNDIAGLDLVSLVFDPPVGPPPGAGYSIEGNAITISDSVVAGDWAYVNLLVDITLTDNVVFSSERVIMTNLNDLNLNGHQLNLDSKSDFIIMRGSISGIGNVVISGDGSGWVDLDGDNTFVGDLIIEANAVVQFIENTAAGNVNNPIYSTGNNATLSIPVDGVSIPNNINLVGGAKIISYGANTEFSGEIEFEDSLMVISNYIVFPSDPVPSLTLSGEIIGDGEITKAGTAELIVSGDSSDFTGNLSAAEGLTIINADLGNASTSLNGGTLGGTGTVAAIFGTNGALDPGATNDSVGTLHVAGDVNLSSLDTLEFQATGPVTSFYDQIEAEGDINIANATLNMTSTYLIPGTTFTILKSTTGTITGEFAGLANFSTVTIGDKDFTIVYSSDKVELQLPVELFLYSFTASKTKAVKGTPIKLDIEWGSHGPTPTGTNTFKDGDKVLGTVTLAEGKASLTVSNLSVGTHQISAIYSGDDVYGGAITGVRFTIVITAPSSSSSDLEEPDTDASEEELPESFPTEYPTVPATGDVDVSSAQPGSSQTNQIAPILILIVILLGAFSLIFVKIKQKEF